MEAAMASAALKNAAAPTAGGSIALEAGRFASSSRAKALATRATRAGFAGARVIERGSGAAKSYVVVLGNWADRDAAREAQARAAKELGLSARMTGPK